MIGSILDVSKMGAGEMKLQREPCDLGALSAPCWPQPNPCRTTAR